jgi:hypothetical protein
VSSDSSATSAPIVRNVLKPSDMGYSSAIVYNKVKLKFKFIYEFFL